MSSQVDLFVLIDALGWTYLEQHGFLNDVLPYRQRLSTILGFSSGAIPTMLTGLPPAEHGHWNLFYYDPSGSPFRCLRPFRAFPNSFLDNRYTRKLIKEFGRHVLGLGPLFECCVRPSLLPWFNWVEKKNIYERGGINGALSIFDRLAECDVPYRVYSYHQGSDAELLSRAEWDIRNGVAQFYFIYLSEVDAFLHQHCESFEQVEVRLRVYESQLTKLFDVAREVDPGATLTVTSDHGMTPVRDRYDLLSDIEKLDVCMPRDYLAVYDSTMARFWFFQERARAAILDTLHAVPCGRVVTDVELRQLGVFFDGSRYGETVFLLHPGWLLARSDFNGTSWAPRGMHGYHPEDPHSDAIFLSNRKPHFTLRTIADTYRWMTEITELQVAPRGLPGAGGR